MVGEEKMELKSRIGVLCKAKYPLIVVESYEETRVISVLEEIAKEQDKGLYSWTVTGGLRNILTQEKEEGTEDSLFVLEAIEKNDDPRGAIFILRDFHVNMLPQATNNMVVRKLRDLRISLKETRKTVVMISPKFHIPMELEKSITILDLPLPSREELAAVFDDAIDGLRVRAEDDKKMQKLFSDHFDEQLKHRDSVIDGLCGLTLEEAEDVIAKCVVSHEISTAIVNEEKKQIIRKGGLLEYCSPDEDMSDVGGLDNMKHELRKTAKRFSKEAEAFGLSKPRGVLLVGPPGTGKSLTVKAASALMNLPLLRMDMGDVASKYYGETTNNLRAALKLADAVAPAILQLDEAEKMFSIGSGSSGGHEETMRALGVLLTHFEESPAPVFRIATCNDPLQLKPEFVQRFEKIFFLGLPAVEERQEIIAIHLTKVNRDPSQYALEAIAGVTEGFVGRELRNLVTAGLETAFDAGVELSTDILLAEAKKVTPMAVQRETEINAIREWASKNAINASSRVAKAPKVAAKESKSKNRISGIDPF